MAADVAVARHVGRLLGGLVLEHLEHGLTAAAVEAQLAHHGPRVHVHVLGHPVVVGPERPERVHVLAAEDVDEPGVRGLEVGDREPDVVQPRQTGDSHRDLHWIRKCGVSVPLERGGEARGLVIGSNLCHDPCSQPPAEESPCPRTTRSSRPRPGPSSSSPRPTGTPRSRPCSPRSSASSSWCGPSRSSSSSSPARASSTARRTRASGRRAARSGRPSR